jgi:hypothetical protein
MRYLRIGFKFKALDDICFPPNPVNTFRGALGFQLLRIACIQRKTSNSGCKKCDLFSSCAYAKCYETGVAHTKTGFLKNSSDMPHLMVLDAGFPGQQNLSPASEFEFKVQLFGHGVETVPYIIVAARNAGLMGLTRQRVSCELLSVYEEISGQKIWSEKNDKLKVPSPNILELQEPDISTPETGIIGMKFITPVAFKDKARGNTCLEPDFWRITGSILRRYSAFAASETGERPEWQFRKITELARQVRLKSINIEPVYWERFSSRQHQRIPITGIIGQASYEGPVKPFIQLVKAGEILRCGRSTSFGQGRIFLSHASTLNNSSPSRVFSA